MQRIIFLIKRSHLRHLMGEITQIIASVFNSVYTLCHFESISNVDYSVILKARWHIAILFVIFVATWLY